MPAKEPTSRKHHSYENNPFTIAVNGLNTLFEKAKGVAILLLVVSIAIACSSTIGNASERAGSQQTPQATSDHFQHTLSSMSAGQWLTISFIALILGLTALCVGGMVAGMSAYTSAQIIKGKTVSISEAFHEVLERFFSFIWLQIIIVVKVLLWSLLFIIPGIVMAVRYSLANIAFFDKGLRGNAAVKESLRLSQGAWLTTYAALGLFNFLTAGVIGILLNTGTRAMLYHQFTENDERPAAHWLSWVTLALPFVLLFLLVMFVIMFVSIVALTGSTY